MLKVSWTALMQVASFLVTMSAISPTGTNWYNSSVKYLEVITSMPCSQFLQSCLSLPYDQKYIWEWFLLFFLCVSSYERIKISCILVHTKKKVKNSMWSQDRSATGLQHFLKMNFSVSVERALVSTVPVLQKTYVPLCLHRWGKGVHF